MNINHEMPDLLRGVQKHFRKLSHRSTSTYSRVHSITKYKLFFQTLLHYGGKQR